MNNDHKTVLLVYLAPEDSNYQLGGKNFYQIVRRPQLGFQYMSKMLEKKGIANEILDQTISRFDETWIVNRIREGTVWFVGFYTVDALEDKIHRYTKAIKNSCPEAYVVTGGPGTLAPMSYLKAGCDIVCQGEGEEVVVEIVEHLRGERGLDSIRGITYRENEQIIRNSRREPIKPLDRLPFPNRDNVDINAYRDLLIVNNRLPYTTMITSRGCPHKCTFCTSYIFWEKKVRQRSVRNVIAEIDQLVTQYGIKYISFQDDIFGLNQKWLREFVSLLKSRNYDLKWMCILHPTSFRKNRAEMMNLLKEGGCNTISMGLQSGDPRILQNIHRKPDEPEQVIDLVRLAKERGILTAVNCIFGLPGDTEESIKNTIDFIMSCKPHHAMFYRLTVLKGSELEPMAGEGPLCDLSEGQLDAWIRKATRIFYSNPRILWQLIFYITRHNPMWYWTCIKIFPILVRVLGLRKDRNQVPH